MSKIIMIKDKFSLIFSCIAICISALSAFYSFTQSQTAKAQLKLNEQNLRPFVKYVPHFRTDKESINTEMVLESLNTVPARIIYTELTTWINGINNGTNLHSTSQEILFQHKNGGAELPPILGENFKNISKGVYVAEIGVCVIYTYINDSDIKYWQLNSLYKYTPYNELPLTVFSDEVEVTSSDTKCRSLEVKNLVNGNNGPV